MRKRYILNPDPNAPPGQRWLECLRDVPEPRKLYHIIPDEIDQRFISMADGKVATSKSRYRAELRARDMVEIGNERPPQKRYEPDDRAIQESVERAWSQYD